MSCQHENLEAGKCTNPDCNYCLHEVKFGGLCALCGSVVEEESGSPVDHIKMSHKDTGVTVSLNEAKRLEEQDEKRLLKERKLSLIVDLDQTILHATWEPYIADWVKDKKQHDSNSVKDISQFTLDGSPLIYSIKLRPGLYEFLQAMSKKYEMHIYTMGTRSYAEAVVKEIDPNGILFQDRILSRDENGSMTKKRLERLFPSDSSKVVVLDDRADVWDYTPNLIQIKPYEYFIGIGDINSPFAQPKKDIIPSAEALLPTTATTTTTTTTTTTVEEPIISTEKETAIVQDKEKEEEKESSDNKEEESTEKTEEKDDIYSDTEDDESVIPSSGIDSTNDEPPTIQNIESNALLKVPNNNDTAISLKQPSTSSTSTHLPNTHDNDSILRVIKKALNDVHNVYFHDLIERNQKPDVAIILNSLKAKVFKGCTIVFSGVIPLQQKKPEESWIWRMATSFGATCVNELTGKVTHLIAANPGTTKVNSARNHGNIKIVSPAWITDSVWNWQKQDETKYLLSLAESSPAESEIENPESTSLEIEFNWEDDEVDAILGDESGDDEDDEDDEEEEGASNLNPSQDKNVTDDDDEEEEDVDSFLADMDAILDSDDNENDDQEYGESNNDDDSDNGSVGKRERDGSDNEQDFSSKKKR